MVKPVARENNKLGDSLQLAEFWSKNFPSLQVSDLHKACPWRFQNCYGQVTSLRLLCFPFDFYILDVSGEVTGIFTVLGVKGTTFGRTSFYSGSRIFFFFFLFRDPGLGAGLSDYMELWGLSFEKWMSSTCKKKSELYIWWSERWTVTRTATAWQYPCFLLCRHMAGLELPVSYKISSS